MSTPRTHYVYEAYDADGLLLYVGCTGNPTQRYKAHMSGNGDARGWFHPFVTKWRVSGPYPRAVAFPLEKKLIAERRPIWNGHTPGNLNGGRKLIEDYLASHGVRFSQTSRANRPVLVPVPRRHLKALAS